MSATTGAHGRHAERDTPGGRHPVRVVVVDDAAEVRKSLASALGQLTGISIVGLASDGLEAIELVRRERPNVVIMDLRMPQMDGIQATRHVARNHPETAVLVLSAYGDESLVIEALMAGARGYLLKGTRATELAEAIISAAGGQARIAGRVTRPVLERLVDALGQERETRKAAEDARITSERLNERQQQFVTMAAHELRTPVTALLGSLATLERLLRPERVLPAELDLLAACTRQARRLSRLVEDLMVVADEGRSGITVNPRKVEVAQAVAAVVADLDHLGSERIKVTVPPRLAAWTDPDRLGQVLTNVVRNALQYSPPDTPVEVVARTAADMVEVTVADRGPGIPDDEMKHLFERFGRPGPSAAGLGVGLWTVRELLDAMKGTIKVERNHEGGSTFLIAVPAAAEAT
ncbi:MAG TPA: hybrid sensor histidine kinase/response regulator [Actinomycetes bacterium]|jgi:signal transduction histidine kinase|nr:hybrid sensor histidine kinase/response regulator [Actinomycetes bacterium]